MRAFILLGLGLFSFFMTSLVFASYTPYCQGTQATTAEDAVIQRLAPRFGIALGCEIGDNCLAKESLKRQTTRFSLNWKAACGPTKDGKKVLKKSIFVCQAGKKGDVCCYPYGYERNNKFKLCYSSIIKKR